MKAEQRESLHRLAQIPIQRLASAAKPVKKQATMKRCLVQNAKDFWRIENAEAIAEQNEDVAKHGLPFAKYRQF
ncbi:UNVERIFIED_ORG: post-segregation antitoxin (ccd killing protein) [Rhizobium etli]|uniref:type II toxin-antitoxin system CcdA family antitoxin n=1 Tax=Rhizobium sp. Kim5 TaxID=2020311 RepID=UPI00098F9685|nr:MULTISPECIES: type II toxin-antitoxin system CcdA family antitoxin [Rhizobium]ARQ56378.1 post-segregation antitoxin CcdA protein [Rhizobium sp. Kim5]RSB90202.1 hypothetical protein EFR00_26320 [Rhizobium sophoriradicis]